MTLAGAKAARKQRRSAPGRESPERGRRIRRRRRPPRAICSPGTTAMPACCRGAPPPARPPIPTGSGCRRSCCSRPRSRRWRPISPASWRAGRRSQALAAAPLEEVLKSWAGLGYYARARNLHACARAVVEQHGGAFPSSEAGLAELPGIGPYTAAAIAAIAFGARAAAVDGNVERVVARLFALEQALPAAKPQIRKLAAGLVPDARSGDFAQAMMDLGATICTPKRPACAICPWMKACAGVPAWRSRELSAPRAQARAPAAARRRLRGAARRRLRAHARASPQGAARRHDRGAVDRMDARFRCRAGAAPGAATRTRAAEMAAPAGRGAPRVHAFSARAA